MTKNHKGKSFQPMHTAPAHAKAKSHHKRSPGHGIILHWAQPCNQYSRDIRKHGGPNPMHNSQGVTDWNFIWLWRTLK